MGHSTHSLASFSKLLQPFEITTVVDVRSQPSSRFAPEFNRRFLERELPHKNMEYVFLGHLLGGRPHLPDHYDEEGRALYYKMARSPDFEQGIELINLNSAKTSIAIMCSEGKPYECHRHLLIERVLKKHGVEVVHILPDGSTVTFNHPAAESHTLFSQEEDRSWKSVQSVLRSARQKTFSIP